MSSPRTRGDPGVVPRGQHRAPSIPDLIIAATAELAGLIVLHLDKHFDLIAEITAQPMERLSMDSAAETGSHAEQAGALSFPIAVGAAGQTVPSGRDLRTPGVARQSL